MAPRRRPVWRARHALGEPRVMKGLAAVGDVLAGKYRVDKILGIGGMGMVVAATHLEIDQRVALKFMLPGTGESPDTALRFLREARAAGRLNSDHVCRVFDVGRFDSGAPYIVMEYLKGESVAALLRRHGPLRVADAVDLILQAIEGLAEAHAHGIIHRDLKPDNLFLHQRNDGGTIVKVLDFGISKISATGISTRTGDVMGSPAYMAPEQMESTRGVDHRADVWSLGVVLYQLVVGRAPFRGDTLPLLCMAVVNDEPEPMSAVRGDLPDGFEAAVMRCLRKEPDERYADVGELAGELAPFGPSGATTSASRIQVVLQRTAGRDSVSTLHHQLGVGDGDAIVPAPDAAERRRGDTLAGTTGREGRPWGLLAAILVGLGVGTVVVAMLWRTGWIGGGDAPEPPAVAGPSAAPSAPVPASPPAPIVEPIVDEPPPPAAPPTPAPSVASAPAAATAPAPTVESAPATATAPSAATPEHKRRRPARRPGGTLRGSAVAAPGSTGSDAGSGSATPGDGDDDKWTHMTHDEKQP